jgi:hypothetical protein
LLKLCRNDSFFGILLMAISAVPLRNPLGLYGNILRTTDCMPISNR